MRITYIHQYFKTPEEGGAIRSYYIARAMAQNGWKVNMITSWNGGYYRYAAIEGIHVHYLPVFYTNALGSARRIWAFFRFAYLAYKLALRLGSCDKFYITSTPLTTGISALFLRRKTSIPFVFEVRDLWPEAPVQVGVIRQRWLIKLLKKLESKIYRSAEQIIALSPGIKRGIEDIYPHQKITVCPNMSDTLFYQTPVMEVQAKYEKFQGQNKLVVAYFGALGRVNALEEMIAIADFCEEKGEPIQFLIAGDGAYRHHLQGMVRSKKLENVHFLGHIGKSELREMLKIVDIAYCSFQSLPVLQTNSPNKFFDGLASGKVMAIGIEGWLKGIVEQGQCGFFFDQSDPADFVKKAMLFYNNPELIDEYGRNSKTIAEDFHVDKLTNKILEHLSIQPFSYENRRQKQEYFSKN